MQVAIRALIKSYCEALAEQMVEVAGHFESLQQRRGEAATALCRSLDIVHQITGLSGSMGYPEISVKAAELEKFIRHFDKTGTCPNDIEMARMADLFQSVKELTDTVTPEASTLNHVDFSRFAVAASGQTEGREAS